MKLHPICAGGPSGAVLALVACTGIEGPVVTTLPGDELAAGGGAGVGGGQARATLQTDGRRLLDACGNVLVIRGVEQILGEQLPPGNDWAGLMDQIAETGANAVRILPAVEATLSVSDVDGVLTRTESHGMIAFLSPDDATWLGREDVRTMLTKHGAHLIIDAFGGAAYDDRTRFLADALAAVEEIRGYGYQQPLTVLSNLYGRDLPAALEHGAEIVAADPLHNVILGWQARWGDSGWYQDLYGMTLTEGIQAASAAAFPVQIGIDRVTDTDPVDTMDYQAAMTEAEARGTGWLWWDWYNPYGADNNLTQDGSFANLLDIGRVVVLTHPAGIAQTSTLPCLPP